MREDKMTMRPTRRALLAAAAYTPALALGFGSGSVLAAATTGLDSLAHSVRELNGQASLWAGAPKGEAQRMGMLALPATPSPWRRCWHPTIRRSMPRVSRC
jgi:nitrous oxide reductase